MRSEAGIEIFHGDTLPEATGSASVNKSEKIGSSLNARPASGRAIIVLAYVVAFLAAAGLGVGLGLGLTRHQRKSSDSSEVSAQTSRYISKP